MSLRRISGRTLLFSVVLFCFLPLLSAEAQDVDVPGNLTMHDSTSTAVGNVWKEGVPFLHNFGTSNTFLGSGAGNATIGMSAPRLISPNSSVRRGARAFIWQPHQRKCRTSAAGKFALLSGIGVL